MADYDQTWETLGLEQTVDVDLGQTIGSKAVDWRDTLRDSLPRLPIGSHPDAHFRIGSELGKGGMGVVHLAYQSSLGRDVAIKTVHAGVVSRDAENALLQEARVMGLVEHPNIVPVHIIGQDETGRPIIVMKRIDGTSWGEYIDGREAIDGDPVAFHLRIAIAICNALSLAHTKGILHRDIKPENVMIGRFGEVYVLDWGLAVSMNPAIDRIPYVLTADQVVGTPAFMAPEMTVADPSLLGVHTDIWLIGAVIYHFATGQPPNQGSSLFDALRFAYEGDTRAYPETTPAELRDIAERAMAHRPVDRFESVEALQQALVEFDRHRSSHELVAAAQDSMRNMEHAIEAGDHDSVHQHSGEARFGFKSALRIWAENTDAKEGIQRCLEQMFDFEIGLENISAARVLLSEMEAPRPDLVARLTSLEAEAASKRAKLGKLAFDYDDSVGVNQRRILVVFMSLGFLAAPVLLRLFPNAVIPRWLLWAGNDISVVLGNVMGLAFAPVFLVFLVLTYRNYGEHKTSRIIAVSLTAMYASGVSIRTSSIWGEVPLHFAASAEAVVYGCGLMLLGLGTDRRLFPAGLIYAFFSPFVLFFPAYTLDLFSFASVVACYSFFFYERLNRRWKPERVSV